ncbi:hypothetical protein KTE19_01400 [Lentilactobacillus sp. IMAU92037]|uniref:hypothetical protein n=1 Tax=Lentilactobacillus TaxID=2767893 RepID=UPI001C274889|nr:MULTISPECIES: hypothetical protein [Lentilactobacillus]MBU9789166.1 hypothetical protein [Lentilactobacillus dabitei]MBV0929383.1 hypothetical protein [Lentilactobacillus dabitei]MDM7516579.1 hypothetical protein [Lentilactobacillus sp. TOM.63]
MENKISIKNVIFATVLTFGLSLSFATLNSTQASAATNYSQFRKAIRSTSHFSPTLSQIENTGGSGYRSPKSKKFAENVFEGNYPDTFPVDGAGGGGGGFNVASKP